MESSEGIQRASEVPILQLPKSTFHLTFFLLNIDMDSQALQINAFSGTDHDYIAYLELLSSLSAACSFQN
jgi:hypothetical protein